MVTIHENGEAIKTLNNKCKNGFNREESELEQLPGGEKRMNLHTTIIIVSALLLAVAFFMPCMRAEDCASAEVPQQFLANIGEVISYEEMAENMKNYTPPKSIPESKMAYVFFSESWFKKNDEDPERDIVQLTFPATWLDKPRVNGEEPVIRLRVPMELLLGWDENPDPKIMTVSIGKAWFKRYPNLKAAQPEQESSIILSLNKQVRVLFTREATYSGTWISDMLDPISSFQSNENP